jgi:hypothetical protein
VDEIVQVSIPFLLFLVITAFCLTLSLWAAASAAMRIAEHGGTHRAWTMVAATLLPPAAAAAALGPIMGWPQLQPVIVVVPILILAGTWSNMMTLRDQGLQLKLLHMPVLAFNASLAGIYSVRAVQELAGFDLGTWGTAITGGHSLLQTWVGQTNSSAQTIWLHLPFLMPLWLQYRWTHKLVLTISSVFSLALLGLLTLLMPLAYQRAEQFRQPLDNSSLEDLPMMGVKVNWGDRILSEDVRDRWRSQFMGMGADCMVIDVSPELFSDQDLFTQTKNEIELARRHGIEIALICRPPMEFSWLPASNLQDFSREMAKLQWLAAERLEPDLLVLFAGPFGRLRSLTHDSPTIEEWREKIVRSAQEAKQANKKVAVAVAFENLAPHTRKLFAALAKDDSPIDVLSFFVHSTNLEAKRRRELFVTLDLWCSETDTEKPIWILEAGASPRETGGELGQWYFLDALIQDARRRNQVRAFCIDALSDGLNSFGITTTAGRPRLAYRKLQNLIFGDKARPPK